MLVCSIALVQTKFPPWTTLEPPTVYSHGPKPEVVGVAACDVGTTDRAVKAETANRQTAKIPNLLARLLLTIPLLVNLNPQLCAT